MHGTVDQQKIQLLLDIKTELGALKSLQARLVDLGATGQAALKRPDVEARRLTASMSDLAKTTGVATVTYQAFQGAINAVSASIRTFLTDGVRFNATLESSALGVAAVLKQFNPDKYLNFNDAIKASTVVIAALKKEALTTAATFEELLVAYQGSAGAMAAAGVPLEKQVKLIANISQAMAGLGIQTSEMRQEATALLMGNIDRNARLAMTLGITAEQIALAKEQGRLYEFLTGRLAAFSEAGKIAADTIAVLESNLKDASTQIAADNTKELTEAYRELLKALTDLVRSDAFSQLLKGSADVATGAVGIVNRAVRSVTDSTKDMPGVAGRRYLADAASITGDLEGAKSAEDLAALRSRAKDGLLAFGRDNLKRMQTPGSLTYADEDIQKITAAYKSAYAEIEMEGSKAVSRNSGQAILDKKAEGEKKSLDANVLITEEIRKQYKTAESKLEAARLDVATDKQKLLILDEQSSLAIALYEKRMAAAEATKDDIAANKAEQLLSLALLEIEKERQKVKKSIADETDRAQKKADAELKKADELLRKTQEQKLARQLGDNGASIDKIDSDKLRTNEAKAQEIIALRGKRNELLDKQIKEWEATDRLKPDPANQTNIQEAINEKNSNNRAIADATPLAPGDGFQLGAVNTVNKFGSDADIVARGVESSFQGVFEGLSSSIQGLIEGTMTWGDALRNIGSTILQSVIGAISDMFAAWLVKRAAMGVASIAWHKAETANVIADETAALPVKTAGAVASGISSWGLAMLGGIAALALIASIGFSTGGYTGDGGVNEPAGIAHKGEVVFSQADVRRHGGVEAVENLRVGNGGFPAMGGAMAAAPVVAAGAAPVSVGGTKINLAMFDGRMSAEKWAASAAGEAHIVDVMKRNIHSITGQG